jgi:hypothetical protein
MSPICFVKYLPGLHYSLAKHVSAGKAEVKLTEFRQGHPLANHRPGDSTGLTDIRSVVLSDREIPPGLKAFRNDKIF